MSPFDILPRSLPRSADAQSLRDQSNASGGSDGGSSSKGDNAFNSLLQGLSERPLRNGGEAPMPVASEQLEVAVPENVVGVEGESIANSVFAILQGILPDAGAQRTVENPQGSVQKDGASPQSQLEHMIQMQDGEEKLGSSPAPKLMVAVRHQEAHFKPVVESLDLEEVMKGVGDNNAVLNPLASDKAISKTVNASLLDRQGSSTDTRTQSLPLYNARTSANLEAPVQFEGIDASSNDMQNLRQADEHSDVRKTHSTNTATQNEVHSLPGETLHRIASAVKLDLQSVENPSKATGAAQTVSVKASESVLRVLNLQLHPADLGAVTIKMRLAGDGLEMELHVEREETAQLLRSDTEKLSSLLRGSGYRPDTISIHVSDASFHDRSPTSRTQSDMEMQGHSFQHGGSSQDERPRNRDKQYANVGAGHQRHADDDKAVGSRSTGDVYL
jgi:chemotaxis protein MotD